MKIVPVTGAEAMREATVTQRKTGEICSTSKDGQRYFLKLPDGSEICVTPKWLGTAANEAARLALNTTHPRFCFPFDICKQADTGVIYICISNRGADAGDWEVFIAPTDGGSTNNILNGSVDPDDGDDGVDGDFYINTVSLQIFGPKTGGVWGAGTSIKGPTGDDGDPGAAGEGVPVGGTVGQVLTKVSGTDFDTAWQDSTGGGSASLPQRACVQMWHGPDSKFLNDLGAPCANGDRVGMWTDQSRWMRHHGHVAGSSKRPTYRSNANSTGFPGIEFANGTQECLLCENVAMWQSGITKDFTLMQVRKCGGTTAFHPLMGWNVGDSTNRIAAYTYTAGSGEEFRCLRGNSVATDTGYVANTNLELIEIRVRGTSFEFRVNDVTLHTATDSSTGLFNALATSLIGTYIAVAWGSDSWILENVLLDGSADDTTDVDVIRDTLMTYYGL